MLAQRRFQRPDAAADGGKAGQHHSGELIHRAAEARAARILAEELNRRGWRQAEVGRRWENDPGELAIVARLRRETTFPIKDIAARVHPGISNGANANLQNDLRSVRR